MPSVGINPKEFLAGIEKIGESDVRLGIARGINGPEKLALANEWLAEKGRLQRAGETGRALEAAGQAAESAARSADAAERQAAAAEGAQRIAIGALMVAVASGILSVIAMVKD